MSTETKNSNQLELAEQLQVANEQLQIANVQLQIANDKVAKHMEMRKEEENLRNEILVKAERNTELLESKFSTCLQAIDSIKQQLQDLSSTAEKNTELIESKFSTCSQAIESLNKQVQDLSSRYAAFEENLKCHPIASQSIATLVSETNAETAEAMISNLVTSETEAVISDSVNMVISDGEIRGFEGSFSQTDTSEDPMMNFSVPDPIASQAIETNAETVVISNLRTSETEAVISDSENMVISDGEGSLFVMVTSEVPLIMNSGVPDASPETENLQSEANATDGEYHLDFLEELNQNCNDSDQEFIDEIHFADIDWLRRKRSEKRERDISKKAKRTSILRIKALNLSESRWSASQPTSEVSVHSKTEAVISTVSEDHVGVKVKQVKMTANSLGSASPTIGKVESEAKCVVSTNNDTEAVISESEKNMISDGEGAGKGHSPWQSRTKKKSIHHKKGEKATFQPRKKDVYLTSSSLNFVFSHKSEHTVYVTLFHFFFGKTL